MADKLSIARVIKRIDVLERELARLKRDILHSLVVEEQPKESKVSLFGSIRGGDVTEKIIKKSQRNLFRHLKDI